MLTTEQEATVLLALLPFFSDLLLSSYDVSKSL